MSNDDLDKRARISLGCGIASLILIWVPILSWICSIVAIALAGQYERSGLIEQRGVAAAGRVCAILGLIFSIVVFVARVARTVMELHGIF